MFQFHKGAIKRGTKIWKLTEKGGFNSIKVRLKAHAMMN